MEEKQPDPSSWIRPTRTASSASTSSSSNSSPLEPWLLVLVLLLLVLFLLPSAPITKLFTSRPFLIRTSWDSLNFVLVLFAILCGLLARRNTEEKTPSSAPSSPPPLAPLPEWFVEPEQHPTRMRRSGRTSGSYPDLRQLQQWVSTDEWRFSDDTAVDGRGRKWVEQDRGHDVGLAVDTVRPKTPVLSSWPSLEKRKTTVTKMSENELEAQNSNQQGDVVTDGRATPRSPLPPVAKIRRRNVRKIPKHEEKMHIPEEKIISPVPQPPPSPPRVEGAKRNHKRRSSGAKDLASAIAHFYQKKKKSGGRGKRSYDDSLIPSPPPPRPPSVSSPPSAPPPAPRPPPPPSSVLYQLFRNRKEQSKSKRIHSVAATSTVPPPPPPPPPMVVRRQEHKSRPPLPRSSSCVPMNSQRSELSDISSVPPLPSPPSPSSVLYQLFRNRKEQSKSKRIHSVPATSTVPPPPPPPPPMVVRRQEQKSRPPLPRSNTSVPMNSQRSELCDISSVLPPPPPSPSPQKVPEEREERTWESTPFCPSPDVDTKADMFIAKLHEGWRLEKLNSIRQKKEQQPSQVHDA